MTIIIVWSSEQFCVRNHEIVFTHSVTCEITQLCAYQNTRREGVTLHINALGCYYLLVQLYPSPV